MARTQRLISTLVAAMGTSLLVGSVAHAQEPLVALEPELEGIITVEPGEDTLHDAVEEAEPGDTLVLEPGLYVLTHTVLIEKDLTIRGATEDREDVHIAGVSEDFDFEPEIFGDEVEDLVNWGHLLFVRAPAEKVSFSYFTIKGAPEIEAITEDECAALPQPGGPPDGPPVGLNHTECFGDAIHADGVAKVEVDHLEASLNGGNGIWVAGAQKATFYKILGVNNGAFGIDVDSALELSIRHSTFIANQVSGVEAAGHELEDPPLTRDQYVAKVSIKDTVAKGNSEIGIEVERFRKAKIEDITCQDNREDGFDADRVSELVIEDSAFINNLNDAIEVFPVDIVDPNEQPDEFPGSTIEDFDDLEFSGNVGEEINHPPTEN